MSFQMIVVIIAYIIPACLCMAYTLLDTFKQYLGDLKRRAKYEEDVRTTGDGYYYPSMTIFDVLVSIIIPLIPLVNLWFLVVVVMTNVMGSVIVKFQNFIQMPLAPKREVKKDE